MAYGVFKGEKGKGSNVSNNSLGLFPARVKAVILDSTTYKNLYEAFGEEASIGGITFEKLEYPSSNVDSEGSSFALPLFPNFNHYPIEQELVTIIATGGLSSNKSTNRTTYYYLPPINSWTSAHINALPNEVTAPAEIPTSQQKNYKETQAGSTSKTTPVFTNTLGFKYGIKERKDIRPLLPQPGDVSFEGRWGQSIRLGSTNRSALTNTWSISGTEGDPIIIIRNNQYKSTLEPWIPLSEDINADGGSIYISSTQKIPVNTINYKTKSFNSNNPPTEPKEYIKDQVILNSGRLLFVSREDSILLTSANSVHISAARFNVDTNSTTIQSSRIELGSSDSELLHPVLKGDLTVSLLNDIINLLQDLTTACAGAAAGSIPITTLVKFASTNSLLVQKLNTAYLESEDVFTV